jgi:hypothetical protein
VHKQSRSPRGPPPSRSQSVPASGSTFSRFHVRGGPPATPPSNSKYNRNAQTALWVDCCALLDLAYRQGHRRSYVAGDLFWRKNAQTTTSHGKQRPTT